MSQKHALIFVLKFLFLLHFCSSSRSAFLLLKEKRNYEQLISSTIADVLECTEDQTEACTDFKKFLQGNYDVGKENLEWIFPMVDAWGKIPSGILTGNVVDYGQFDECLSIGTRDRPNDANVNGKYCGYAVIANFKGLMINWAICLPSFVDLGVFPNIINENYIQVTIQGATCQINEANKELEWDDWIVFICCLFIFLVIATCTIYDGFLHLTKKEAWSSLFIAFSLITNSKRLFAVSNAPGQIECLHGIRAISLMWIIAGHRYITEPSIPHINQLQAFEFQANAKSGYISSARAGVDTFFLFSALLVSFIYFKGLRTAIGRAEKNGQRAKNPLSLRNIPMFYIHRILRITPALVAVFFFHITLYRRIGEGPLWSLLTDILIKKCTDWWWSVFLYVQNYVNYTEICITPTWYLSADMQMFLLSPFLIIPLGELVIKGKKKLAYILMCVVIGLCIILPMAIEFTREFDKDNIYETHHRLSVYTIGLLFGMILVDCNDRKIQVNHFLNLLLWGAAIAIMAGIVFTMHETEVEPTLEKNNLYFSFTRPLWSVAVCWIVFACHFGYGGPVNWFLSLPLFQVMTKLSFSMYLLHNLVIMASIGNVKVAGHFSEYETMYNWCGDYIFTIVVSIGWVLCFESPVVVLEKVIFKRGNNSAKTVKTGKETVPEVKIETSEAVTNKTN